MANPPISAQVWRPPAAPALDGVDARTRPRSDGWLCLGGQVEAAVARVRLPEAGA